VVGLLGGGDGPAGHAEVASPGPAGAGRGGSPGSWR